LKASKDAIYIHCRYLRFGKEQERKRKKKRKTENVCQTRTAQAQEREKRLNERKDDGQKGTPMKGRVKGMGRVNYAFNIHPET